MSARAKLTMVFVGMFVVLTAFFLGFTEVGLPRQGVAGFGPYGFWSGLFHGFVVPLSLLGDLFGAAVRVYGTANSGLGYDIGFLLGFLLLERVVGAVLTVVGGLRS